MKYEKNPFDHFSYGKVKKNQFYIKEYFVVLRVFVGHFNV